MKNLSYSDIALVPQYSETRSRADIKLNSRLGSLPFEFRLPVIPANMRCVIDVNTARTLQENGYMYIMHRFDIDNVEFLKLCAKEKWKFSSISVGVKEEDIHSIKTIAKKKLPVDCITIDIAHGHSGMLADTVATIKDLLPDTFLIAGNVGSVEAYRDLCVWGADAVKCGIGGGSVCSTRNKTGFYTPMFTLIREIYEFKKYHQLPQAIIADGGIHENGDFAKALVAGADFVMSGKLFAECTDGPAPITASGSKQYFGSASAANKKHSNNIEGIVSEVQTNGFTFLEKLAEIEQDLQSACSYAGGELSPELVKHITFS